MATIATMAMVKPAKILMASSNPSTAPRNTPMKPCISLLALQNLPKGLTTTLSAPSPAAATAMAGAFFAALSTSDAAFAAQQIADIAADDNRGLALLLPIVPAVLWVLYNILQPALNQLNRMRNEKALVVGFGLGAGLAAGGLVSAPSASAGEVAAVAAASDAGDNRGILLLFVVAPAIAWVLYNILQPALNQLNRMRSE